MNMNSVGVLGSGSWATAIVKILSNSCNKINWWIREPEIIEHIANFRHNPVYSSSIEFDTGKLALSNDISEVIAKSDVIVFCIPAPFLQESLMNVLPEHLKGKCLISAIKGIVPKFNVIIADYFNQQFKVKYDDILIVSGPSHAEEVAAEKLTYLTFASQNADLAASVAAMFACRYIKTSTSDDIFGTEYAPVLKNIVAIASGICHGLGYGDNFQAVLVSNAIQEIKRFLDAVHPIDRDIKSSVYLGDLLVTAYSNFSRNRLFGTMIGNGYSVKAAQLEMKMVAEGYYAVKCIKEINSNYKVKMPIIDAVYNIVYENITAVVEMRILADQLS
jgi:glycerol-3-phosphate dehydrogenase (NAD(P)+)